MLWTELGFALEDIGITKLANRCQVKGEHWSNQKHYDENFLNKADVSLESMERQAREILLLVTQK